MFTKLAIGAVASLALAVTGAWHFKSATESTGRNSCCYPGSPCCFPGSPCCEDEAQQTVSTETPACCYPGSPCCESEDCCLKN